MKNIGTDGNPYFIDIAYLPDQIRPKIKITCFVHSNISYIYLENLRPLSGKVADGTKHLYNGKPLWCIQSIDGYNHFGLHILQRVIFTLNTRVLLPDVCSVLYYQLTMFPIDVRLNIIDILKQQESASPSETIFQILKDEHVEQMGIYQSLLTTNHKFIKDYNVIKNENRKIVENEELVSEYLQKLNIDYVFKDEYVWIKGQRHFTTICANLFKLHKCECRFNKSKWYAHVRVHLNMFFILQTILDKNDYCFRNDDILYLCDKWVRLLKNIK